MLFPSKQVVRIVERFDRNEVLSRDVEIESHKQHDLSPSLSDVDVVKMAIKKLIDCDNISSEDREKLKNVKVALGDNKTIFIYLGAYMRKINF